jgi:hypothetical protein
MLLLGFMASRTGRWARILAGAGMVVGGLVSGSSRGAVVALAGLAPLIGGVLDLHLLAPLLGYPLHGADLRRQLGQHEDAALLEGSLTLARPTSHLLH